VTNKVEVERTFPRIEAQLRKKKVLKVCENLSPIDFQRRLLEMANQQYTDPPFRILIFANAACKENAFATSSVVT
jgi:hypothetical protein